FAWDVLSNAINDYRLLRVTKRKCGLIIYITSRYVTLVYVMGRMVYENSLVAGCSVKNIILDCFLPVGISSSSLLFLLRAYAVYNGNKHIPALLAFLWISVLAASLTVPVSTSAASEPISLPAASLSIPASTSTPSPPIVGSCTSRQFGRATVIVATVYDTVVFTAISYKLMSHGFRQSHGIKSWLFGTNLPAFSRAMLRDGQKYYLVTILSNIATIAAASFLGDVDYHNVFLVINTMITNIMACYVFRHTALGKIRDPAVSMDAQVIPTVQDHTTQHRNCTSNTTDGIFIKITSLTHVDDVHKSRPQKSL
ncbi:hypothetical protein GYMLUDRAFT_157361, partial [Collybiopsis luxurians FD-317 M1]